MQNSHTTFCKYSRLSKVPAIRCIIVNLQCTAERGNLQEFFHVRSSERTTESGEPPGFWRIYLSKYFLSIQVSKIKEKINNQTKFTSHSFWTAPVSLNPSVVLWFSSGAIYNSIHQTEFLETAHVYRTLGILQERILDVHKVKEIDI